MKILFPLLIVAFFAGYCFADEPMPPLCCQLTSESVLTAERGGTVFISCLLSNPQEEEFQGALSLSLPEGWNAVPGDNIEVLIPAKESLLKIFGVKISDQALSEGYLISLAIDGEIACDPVFVNILPEVDFSATLSPVKDRYFSDLPIFFELICQNTGNTPLDLFLETDLNPGGSCECSHESFHMAPGESGELFFQIEPRISIEPYPQSFLIKLIDAATCRPLFVKAVRFDVVPKGSIENDPLLRIPAHASVIAVGRNGDHVFVGEIAGEGYIDEDNDRYVDFCLRIPSQLKNVIYNVDQRIFLGLEAPNWDIALGDTVYELTPLTQYYRYGRGGGFDMERGSCSLGSHYTQNIFDNDYNPREACAYLAYSPSQRFTMSANYLHKTRQHIPTSNIATCLLEFELPKKTFTEIEFGKNFIDRATHKDTFAGRFSMRGKWLKDSWFNIEKLYAGAAFYGYYSHVNSFSAGAGFPVSRSMRGALSYTTLRQNFCSSWKRNRNSVAPRQKQLSGTLFYNFSCGLNLNLNGLLFRAKDDSLSPQYNFYQKWGGASLTWNRNSYYFNANMQLGEQRNYLTHDRTKWLQKYYLFLGKDVTERLKLSLYYEGGCINYYDAGPWRTSLGGTLLYRPSNRMQFELMAQRVVNKPDKFRMTQFSARGSYTFKNLNQLQAMVQSFNNQGSFSDNFMFFVSYTVPFGLPVGKRTTIGSVEGCIFDAFRQCPVPEAMVSLNGRSAMTDSEGNFAFSGVPVGEQMLMTEFLPRNAILEVDAPESVIVAARQVSRVSIPVVPPCAISGQIVQYDFDDLYQNFLRGETPRLVDRGGIGGIRVFIDRDHGKETYSCLTDKNGSFCFEMLRPGNWEVSIEVSYLPSQHYLSRSEYVLEMEPAGKKEILFKLLPEELNIMPLN